VIREQSRRNDARRFIAGRNGVDRCERVMSFLVRRLSQCDVRAGRDLILTCCEEDAAGVTDPALMARNRRREWVTHGERCHLSSHNINGVQRRAEFPNERSAAVASVQRLAAEGFVAGHSQIALRVPDGADAV
jgi:hypothetical protein